MERQELHDAHSNGAASAVAAPNDLSAFWMPYTANRHFKKHPRMYAGAKDMHYITVDGREVLDSTAGLWCCNAGHCRPRISEAIAKQAAEMDFAPSFNFGHPKAFELANRIASIAPEGLDHVMFTNSGSESMDTALKTALAYHRARGEGHRVKLIGRERGYHGVNFGGMSVGGIQANRKMFTNLLPNVDHMRHTHDPERNGFSKGMPKHGAELADDLLRLAQLHDPSTIAAVIVEPVAGSTGVLPPPVGYLERLRKHCDDHGILLIFDEVITGFGRIGAAFASERFGVTPDLLTMAKGLTSGVIPMGAVLCTPEIHDTFMNGPDHVIDFFHGYTYSGNPVAAAAALATLEVYKEENLFERANELDAYWTDAMHSFRDHPNVVDIRNIGLMGAIELRSREGEPGKRAYDAMAQCFDKGLAIRITGDTIALSPPLIVEKKHVDQIVETLGEVLQHLD